MTISDYKKLISNGNLENIKQALRLENPPDVAETLEGLPVEESSIIFRLLSKERAASVFEYLSIEKQTQLIRSFANEQLIPLLNSLSPDDRTRLFEELPPEITKQMLAILTPEELKVAHQLLGYPEGSAGRFMVPEYIAIYPHMTCSEALAHVKKHGQDLDTLDVLYVVDEKGKLVNSVELFKIVLAEEHRKIQDMISDQIGISILAMSDRSEVVKVFEKYDRVALPVTDSQGYLLGVITIDDVLDVAEEEATEDMQKMAGMASLDAPYLKSTFGTMIRKRVGWLLILFISEMFTSTAMQYFEIQISKAAVLAAFVPLMISSGGNAGSQAASLIIRSLGTNEIGLFHWKKVLRRESYSGLVLGICLATVGFIRILVGPWIHIGHYGPHAFMFAITVALSLISIVLLGTLTGSMFPLLLKKLRIDPATASAPFVATLVDVSGIIIYFSIASKLLKGLML